MLLGGVIKAVWDGVKDLQKDHKALAEKVNEIEVTVAGDYVRKDFLEKMMEAIFKKLDKIDEKIDRKADK